jgi:PKD repeat protein
MKIENKNFKRLIILSTVTIMCMTGLAVLPTVSADCPDDCPDGMVSYWKMDETAAGPVVDCYGSNDGTNNGATINQPGQVGTAYDFDGVGDYVESPETTSLRPQYTSLLAWIKPITAQNHDNIISKAYAESGGQGRYYSYGLKIHANGKIAFVADIQLTNKAITTTTSVNFNQWYLITATWDGNYMRLFINGTEQVCTGDTGLYSGGLGYSGWNYGVNIGRYSAGSSFFEGEIDEAAIYDRALSPSEISSNYYAGLAGHGYCECPDTVYVDDDYTSSSCGGHNWHWDAFATIQEGVDAVCEGGTVYVADGNYNAISSPFVRITKSLTLDGESRDGVILDGIGTSTISWAKGIHVTAEDVAIKDLTVQNFGAVNYWGYGIVFRDYAHDSSGEGFIYYDGCTVENVRSQDNCYPMYANCFTHLAISDCLIQNNLGDGMFIAKGSADAAIIGNTVLNSGDHGIWVGGSGWCGPSCPNAIITNNYVDGAREGGISFVSSDTALISDNTVTNAKGQFPSAGWSVGAISLKDGCSNVVIRDNLIYENDIVDSLTDSGRGIGIDGTSSNIDILYNTIRDNDGDGIWVSGTITGFQCNYNNIYDNAGYGANNAVGATLDFECNWWGSVSGPTHSSNTYNVGSQGDTVNDNVDYCPWLDAAYPSGSCDWGPVKNLDTGEIFCKIQSAIDGASNYDTIEVSPGVYDELITIEKPLTIRGATYNVCKNGYTVPTDYNWDNTIESIIQPPAGSEDADVVTIDDANDVTFAGFIIQALERSSSGSRMLMTVRVDDGNMENLNIINNVIGANTNLASQDGTKGRMGLYLDINPYDASMGLTDSLISCNKIFDCKGNGNNIFIWASYNAYGATGPSPMTNTYIEDNEICGSHRSGIETAGGFSGLTIRNNDIHSNSANSVGDEPNMLKYGTGILLIRGSGDKTCNGYGPEDLLIEDNEIYNNEKNGIYTGPIASDITITGNNIYDNGWDGIMLDMEGQYWNPTFDPGPGPYPCYDSLSDIAANYNNIYGNGNYGARVLGTPTNGFELDAECNWWGDPSGPTHSSNPLGIGDSVSDYVDFIPWLDDMCPYGLCIGGTCQDEVWVDDNYHSGTPGWNIDHFYHIQDGVERVSSGGIVHVMDGTYQEDIIVDVDSPWCTGRTNLYIHGEDLPVDDNTRALIDGIIEINTDLTILEYFWFMPTTDAAVTVNGNDVTLRNNVFDHGCDPDSIGVYATKPVNAEYNWWGAPNGPNGGLMNDGTTADGYGVQVIGSVDVEPWVGAHAEAEASSYSVETGKSVIFNAAGSFAADFDGTYEPVYYWTFEPTMHSNDKQPAYIFDTPGTYEVSLRVRGNGIGGLHSNFMYDWAYLTITVTSPGAPLSANADGGNLGSYETVVGEPVQLSGLGSGGTPPYSYSWSLGNGRTSSEQNPTVVYENENTYTVTLTVTDSMGATASDTAQVSVYGIDELVVNAGGPYNGVVDTPVYFSGSVIGGVEPYTYSWDLGDGTISDLTNPTHTYESEGTYTVTLTVTDDQGNENSDTATVAVDASEGSEAKIKDIKGGLGLKAIIIAGDSPVSWSIEVNGRVFFGGEASGTIQANMEETVKLPFSFGLGNVDITITANSVTKEATAFMLGPFVLIK